MTSQTLDMARTGGDGKGTLAWPDQIFQKLCEADVKQVVYVPDAGHARLIELCHQSKMNPTVLTTEEEGIGYLFGAWLGGERGVLLMQSSGVGNCLNTLALQAGCRLPLLMLVTMRGDWHECNPWQNPMGDATEAALKLMGIRTWRADDPAEVGPLVAGAAEMAFNGDGGMAVLLGQRLIGK